jgi:acyl-CoA reductase-like NAD-dependent aldehyde dehydrogenase
MVMTTHLRPKALADYQLREFRMLIDGVWVEAARGETLERIAPGHGIAISRYQSGTKEDAEKAVEAARNAFDHGTGPA